jgi:hypothetical protein
MQLPIAWAIPIRATLDVVPLAVLERVMCYGIT